MHTLIRGAWLTLERIRIYSWMLVVFGCAVVLGIVFTGHGILDAWGRPLGTDFANVWSAGYMVWEGRALSVYDALAHYQFQQSIFGEGSPFYGWHYPPFFLLIASALAGLPYGVALVVWIAVSLPLYLKAVHAILSERLALLAGVGFPAVLVNVLHGQNGFVTAALMGAGLWQLDRRPIVSGIAFGLLSYKPQFGVLIPLVLIATRRWSVFASALSTVAMMAGVSTWVFGVGVWQAFFESTHFTRVEVLEHGAAGWAKLQSLLAGVRALGGGLEIAYSAQALLALTITVGTVWLWRSRADQDVKSAGVVVGALLATPYVMDYDLVMLALPLAWMTKRGLASGFLDWEKTVLAAVWFMPLFARVVAHVSHVPIGLMILAVFYGLILSRAWREHQEPRLTGS